MVQADRARPRSEDSRAHRRAAPARHGGTPRQMIDIQQLRKDPVGVEKRLAVRGPGAFDADQFERFEKARKDLQTAVEQAQASRNRIAKDIGQAKAKGHDVSELLRQGEKLKSLLRESEQQLVKLQEGFQDFLARIPNIPHHSVPVGESAE